MARRMGEDEATAKAARLPTISPDGAILAVLSGKGRGRTARVPGEPGESLTIGKSAESDLVLDEPTVSRLHARLLRTASGLEIQDLESTNGTYASGVRTMRALVEPGTVIRVGDVELLVAVGLEDVAVPPSEARRFGAAVGTGLAMRRIFAVLERIAPTNATVLLLGETGTGKDTLARAIHDASGRRDGPFEVLDCGAISANLVESELFGHERGAFTGAIAERAGAFERARGGTLFLDEIGELRADLQPKLLRALEAREIRRVGGSQTIPVDVRIVAATTRDLEADVKEGAFREDLWFRLAVVPIRVPPLRQRLEDLAQIVPQLLASLGSSLEVPSKIYPALRAREWRGNIRELRNVVERSMHWSIATDSRVLQLAELGGGDAARPSGTRFDFDDAASYGETRARFEAEFERAYIGWLLEKHGGNVSAASRAARMDRNHLTDLARRHGLHRK